MSKVFILLALLCAAALSQTNTCPGYAAKDLINTGKSLLKCRQVCAHEYEFIKPGSRI